ncbi:MAG: DUF2247 family protein [Candidatus Dependentiae bacterium]|nr:DUF2247 family protein [Candidatus Dependentiae bacterium]
MFQKNDKKRLFWLIDKYLSDKIDAQTFEQEYLGCYYAEMDFNTLMPIERTLFAELSTIVELFSPHEESHKELPGVYYTEQELRQKAMELQELRHREVDYIKKRKKPHDAFRDNDIIYSWQTIKVGRDIEVVTFDDLIEFALHFLESHPGLANQYISELMFASQDQDIDELFKNIFVSLDLEYPQKGSPAWNKEWRKWRYCLFRELVRIVENKEELLFLVDSLCADFAYPEDMISYLPSDDNATEDDRVRIVNELKLFLNEEKVRIDQGCDTLPETSIRL